MRGRIALSFLDSEGVVMGFSSDSAAVISTPEERRASMRRPRHPAATLRAVKAQRPRAVVLVTPGHRKEAANALRETRLDVVIAASTSAALDELLHCRPGIVIVEMKCIDGDIADFVALVRQVPTSSEVPLVLVGANKSQARRALTVGMADVVSRPVCWEIAAERAARIAAGHETTIKHRCAAAELEELRVLQRLANDRVQSLDTIDAMTGLPNRKMFGRIVDQSIPSAHRRGLSVALLHIDIDRFSEINQTLGRRIGDRVIQEVAKRLDVCLRESTNLRQQRAGISSATLARLGSDEFAVLLGGVSSADEAKRLADELLAAVAGVVVVDGREVFLTASLGIALSAANTDDRGGLLQSAEAVTADARREGGGCVRIHNSTLDEMTARKRVLLSALRNAFDRRALFVHYQPIVDVASGRMVAAEALLRWNDPELGFVSPAEFVPLAEETGLMVPIGSWVLNTACLQLRRWLDAGLPKIRMAVNVSLCQLQRGNMDEVTERVLQASGIEPGMLELEISERGGLPDDPRVLEQLHRVRDLGVRLSVDDFGTGESAIAYLRRLPINMLKIDRSYVARFEDSDDDAVIASAMIAMAHGLKLEVVAEGVEETSQLGMLKQWGCDEFQGFLYSKAVGVEDFTSLLRDLHESSQEAG